MSTRYRQLNPRKEFRISVYAKLKLTAILSLEIDCDLVKLKLASGRLLTWPNKGGMTIHGERVRRGLEADISDVQSSSRDDGRLKDGSRIEGLKDWQECPACRAWHKTSETCQCKADAIRKLAESEKPS